MTVPIQMDFRWSRLALEVQNNCEHRHWFIHLDIYIYSVCTGVCMLGHGTCTNKQYS